MQNNKMPYLYHSVVPLRFQQHQSRRLATNSDFSFAAKAHMVPVHAGELAAVACSYPIIFIGEDKTPAAALGLEAEQNLFITANNGWPQNFYQTDYLRRHPFIAVKTDRDNETILCFDDTSNNVADTAEGPELFTTEQQLTDAVQAKFDLCMTFDTAMAATKTLIAHIDDLDLFCSKTVSYRSAQGEPAQVQFISIDENEFNALSDDEFLALRKSGALHLIYSHFNSMHCWNRLIARVKTHTAEV